MQSAILNFVLKDKVEDAVEGRTGGRHLTDGDAMAADCADEVLLKRQSVATCREDGTCVKARLVRTWSGDSGGERSCCRPELAEIVAEVLRGAERQC